MASARKKQDEKNLKTLRELVSLPYNKYCFDCNQRGPTYVNVTIGSFVCTKCSGLLRGLTPPHRVKSISMATFTTEEVELVQNRGNDHCRRTWLGLYEGAPLAEGRDEQQIHDLMVDKYEKRRYYIDQPVSGNSGSLGNNNTATATSISIPRANGVSSAFGGTPITTTTTTKPLSLNGVVGSGDSSNTSRHHSPLRRVNGVKMKNNGITISRPVVSSAMTHNNLKTDFIANFDKAEIFNAANNNNNNSSMSNGIVTNGVQSNHHPTTQQPSFANFDNNPVFTNTNPFISPNHQDQCPYQREWGSLFDSYDNIDYSVHTANNVNQQKSTANVQPAPSEDRYAALKDLDNALKNQSTLDWGSSNSSLYSSPTPTSSMYNSSSPQSLYGSPSQGQFISIFSQQETGSNTSNPFNSGQLWGNSSTIGTTATPLANGLTNGSNPNPNPFRLTAPTAPDPFKMNGFTQSFQQPTAYAAINASWTANPFKVTSNGHSSNPFL